MGRLPPKGPYNALDAPCILTILGHHDKPKGRMTEIPPDRTPARGGDICRATSQVGMGPLLDSTGANPCEHWNPCRVKALVREDFPAAWLHALAGRSSNYRSLPEAISRSVRTK